MRFFDAEFGDAWGPYGLGYYISRRVLWDCRQAKKSEELFADFLQRAFGPAQSPMEQFYRLITVDSTTRSASDRLGRMYRFLDQARRLAQQDAAVKKRIDDLILYTRYYELYTAYGNAVGKDKAQQKKEFLSYVYRIRRTMMVHAYGIWARMASQTAFNDPKNSLHDNRPFKEAEILQILRSGIAANQLVELDFKPKTFSRNLVPAATVLHLKTTDRGSYPTVPQDFQTFFIWVEKAPAAISLKVRTRKVWKKRMPRISLFSDRQAAKPVAVDSSWTPDNQWHEIVLKTPFSGLHRVELVDGGDYTYVQWPKKMPVTLESGMGTRSVQSQFRGRWTLYFYVPRGTRVIGGWAQRIAQWAPRISGVLKGPDGKVYLDFGKQENAAWFKVDVPTGLDGKLWKFENSQGMRRLTTVPPYLAVSAEKFLLPAEVLK